MRKPSQAVESTSEMKEREITIGFRVTESERKKFLRLAESRYMTISELARQLLHREADTEAGKAA